MVTIGNTTLPGVQTTVESSRSVGVGVGSPGDVLLIGQADLEDGQAEPNKAYQIRTPSRSRFHFGDGSPLSDAAIDSLREGAFPVYGIAPENVAVEAEEVISSTGSVVSAPVSENASDTTFTVDSTALTTVIVWGDPSEETPGSDEALLNPVTGEYNLDAGVITSASVDYVHVDYAGAISGLNGEAVDRADFIGVLAENEAVVSSLVDEVEELASNYNFAIAVAGASSYIGDFEAYTNEHNTSRLQLVYPSRNADGKSIIGSYLGVRSSIGINASPMRNRIGSQNSLVYTLKNEEKELLLGERVNPISNERSGSRIVDDVTTVTDDNVAERNMKQGISRLVIDFVTVVVHENSDDFIGELHTVSARNALQNIIKSELKDLLQLNAITAYSVAVQEEDSMTASVDVGVETVAPLRNIVATVTAGEVEDAV